MTAPVLVTSVSTECFSPRFMLLARNRSILANRYRLNRGLSVIPVLLKKIYWNGSVTSLDRCRESSSVSLDWTECCSTPSLFNH